MLDRHISLASSIVPGFLPNCPGSTGSAPSGCASPPRWAVLQFLVGHLHVVQDNVHAWDTYISVTASWMYDPPWA
jgi:hypothetical protein